jgi:hypothetical protein
VLLVVMLSITLPRLECGAASGSIQPAGSTASFVSHAALITGSVARLDRSSLRNGSAVRAFRFIAVLTSAVSLPAAGNAGWLERMTLVRCTRSANAAPGSPRAPPRITSSVA